jgi:hypothetical protein
MPLRVPGRSQAAQTPSPPPSAATAGIAASPTLPVPARTTAVSQWQAAVRPIALPILTQPRPVLTTSQVLSALAAVREILTGMSLGPYDGLPIDPAGMVAPASQHHKDSSRGGAHPPQSQLSGHSQLPPDIRAVLFLRGQLRDLAIAACPVVPKSADYMEVTRRVLRQFSVYDFGAWVVAHAIMGRYNTEVEQHSAHTKFGDCPCVSGSATARKLFNVDMAALPELRMMWNLRVLSVASEALAAAVVAVLRQVWSGESGDMQLVLATIDMARRAGARDWTTNVILGEWTRHCQDMSKDLMRTQDRAMTVTAIRQRLDDARTRVVDPLPEDVRRPMLAVASSVLVLSHKVEWAEALSVWFLGRRMQPIRELWALRSFASSAGASGAWFLDSVEKVCADLMYELKARLPPGECKVGLLQTSVLDAFDEQVSELVVTCCDGNAEVRSAAYGGGYSALFRVPSTATVSAALSQQQKPSAAQREQQQRHQSADEEFFGLLTAQLLHQAAQNKDAEARERVLEQFMTLLRYLPAKDLCLDNCRLYLETRLLTDASASEGFEAEIVQRIQAEGLHSYARDMQGVLSDFAVAQIVSRDNARSLPGEPQLSVTVLKTGAWRHVAPMRIHLAVSVLQRQLKRFSQSYLQHANAKKVLNWCHGHGWAKVALNYTKSRHVVVCPLTSAVLLATFDLLVTDELTLEALEQTIHGGVAPEAPAAAHVAKCINALVKAKVLTPLDGAAKSLRVNRDFKSVKRETNLLPKVGAAARRADPNTPAASADKAGASGAAATTEARDGGAEKAQPDVALRRMLVDSATVRVLKSRRVIQHQELVETVIETLRGRFVPTPTDVKKTVERLLEMEYCSRLPNDPSSYQYLA